MTSYLGYARYLSFLISYLHPFAVLVMLLQLPDYLLLIRFCCSPCITEVFTEITAYCPSRVFNFFYFLQELEMAVQNYSNLCFVMKFRVE